MKNISKILLLFLSTSLFLPACHSSNNSSSEVVQEEIKVKEISFSLLTDRVYLNHNIMIQDLKILPASATNKQVKWSLKDEDMGIFKEDFIYTTKAGDTTIICESTDGSNVKYELPVHILPLEAPSYFETNSIIYGCVDFPIVPQVSFIPDSDLVNKNIDVEILTPNQDVVEFKEDGTLYGKNVGQVNARISSSANPLLSKNIIIDVGNDLLTESIPETASLNNYNYVDKYGDHKSVGLIKYNSTPNSSWPGVNIKLAKTLNLGREKIKLDILRITGSSLAEVQLLDARGNIVKQKYGADYPMGDWKTLTIANDKNYDVDIYSIRIIVDTKKYGDSNITQFAIDNLSTEEIAPTEIVVKQPEIDIDLENQFSLRENFEFLPADATSFLYNLQILSGEENVEIVNKKLLKGKKVGEAMVRVISECDPTIYADIKVNVLNFVPHVNATYHPAGGRLEVRIPHPIDMAELDGRAIAIDFKFTSNGFKTFGFNYAPYDWYNISNEVIIANYNGNVVCNMGVIVTDKYEGWYTLIINEYYLHGDGKNQAKKIDLAYSPEDRQTADGYIDWTSLRVVDQSFRIKKNVETYKKGETAEHASWDRFTLKKLSYGALAMDFKLVGEGEFKFSINNYEKNVIQEVTLTSDGSNVSASRGKVIQRQDGWITYVINYEDFPGDTKDGQIDTFKSSSITVDSLSIDWQSIRLVPKYE